MTETNGSGQSPQAIPKIRVRDLHKAFGAHKVLDGLDIDVAEQESVVVIGGSGTGKSVLLKCILGILEPDAGTIEVDGQNVVGLKGAARDQMLRKFGMLFQNAALFDSLKRLGERLLRPDPARQDGQAGRPPGRDRQAGAGRAQGERRRALPGGTLRRHEEARRPCPRDRDEPGDHLSSTSPRPGWTRSWAT